MKNITVTVPDETYRLARIWAARKGTSVSALVRRFLESMHHYPTPNIDHTNGSKDAPVNG